MFSLDVPGSLPAGVHAPALMQAKALDASSTAMQVGAASIVPRSDVLNARKGLAAQARAAAWLRLSGAHAKRDASTKTFHQLACCDCVPDDTLYAIEEDCRVMPLLFPNPIFTTTRGVDTLSRLLLAFYQRNPSSGYLRGHTARLAALLLVVHGVRNVEDAFWNFCALMEDRLYGHYDVQIPLGATVEQCVLARLVAKKLPIVAEHLSKADVPLQTVTQGWLASCFLSVLPVETAMRIMDSVMGEGGKVLHRVALSVLRLFEANVVSCVRGDCLRKVLQSRMALLVHADKLMQMAFHHVGSLPSALLDKYRAAERKGVEAELAQQQQPHRWGGSSMCGVVSYNRSSSSRSLASGRSWSSLGLNE